MGSGYANVSSEFVAGNLVISAADGTELARYDGTNNIEIVPNGVKNQRFRKTIAQINAGATLLAAVPGFQYRMIEAQAIAYGGAAGAVTTVDILGTQTTSAKLVAFAQASLTQSAVLKSGGTGAAVLADGASYVACDANTAITVGKTGSDVTTATGIDFIISYVLEAA